MAEKSKITPSETTKAATAATEVTAVADAEAATAAAKTAAAAPEATVDTAEERKIPHHIGFIVDGNRRWARERGLPTLEGHRRGLGKIQDIALACFDRGVKCVSAFMFSTENWGRSQEEVDYLMLLVKTNIKALVKKMLKHNVRCVWLGSENCPRPDVVECIKQEIATTEHCDGGLFCVCFNYGGHREIADAAQKLLADRIRQLAELQENGADLPADFLLLPEEIRTVSESDFADYLYHPEVPPVDLVVRTSGEQRISGFMLWRAAYAEFLFLNRYFPDMEEQHVDEIIDEFNQRHRRFGK